MTLSNSTALHRGFYPHLIIQAAKANMTYSRIYNEPLNSVDLCIIYKNYNIQITLDYVGLVETKFAKRAGRPLLKTLIIMIQLFDSDNAIAIAIFNTD